MKCGYIIAVSVLIGISGIAEDQDWPHIRGSEYNGRANWSGINLPWPESGPPILWKVSPGQGFSSMIVVDGKIYTQAQSRAGQYVVCLNLKTGEELWRTRYGWPWENDGIWPGPYATPSFYNNRIYFTGCYGEAGCVDAETGKTIWLIDITKDIDAELPGFGYSSTPLVYNNKVYLPSSGEGCSVMALNADNGSLVWKTGDDTATYSSCLLFSVEGKKQIITLLENVNVAHDPETGKELWRYEWSEGYDPHPSWLVYEEPYLFRASAFLKGGRVLKLSYKDGKPAVDPVWTNKVMSHDIFSSVAIDGYLYGYDLRTLQTHPDGKSEGSFKCVELATGIEKWKSKEIPHSSVLACGDKLVLLSELGILTIVDASPHEHKELARLNLLSGERCWTVPAIYKGHLLVRNDRLLLCMYLGDPADVKDREPGTNTPLKPDKISAWLDKYQSHSFYGPSLKELSLWFLICLACALLPASIIGYFFLPRPRLAISIFAALSMFLGIGGTALFTMLYGSFIFTCPAAIFSLLLATLILGATANKDGKTRSAIQARIALVFFALFCIGYQKACSMMFIISGTAFLVGLVPVTPLAYFLAKLIVKRKPFSVLLAAELLCFSVFYWTSAAFLIWKNL